MNLFLYLDPGTGSLLLYAVLGVCASLLFIAKKWLSGLKLLLLGRSKAKDAGDKFGIVIYAENGHYYNTFRPILEEFIKHRKPVTYVTSDRNDPALATGSEYVRAICPGNEYKTISFLNGLTADIVVSTTPHLDIYMWRRSKGVKRYVHLWHAPTSIDVYEKYALSFYDVIINAVPEAEAAQRYLDGKRKLPPKTYYTAGCTYFDPMLAGRDSSGSPPAGRSVLYAPSWGQRSSLRTYGEEIIRNLLDAGYSVTFRPHPQSLTADKDKVGLIKERFSGNGRFRIDTDASGMSSMAGSDLMISDFSGVIFDYRVLFGRPVLLASSGLRLGGYEVEDLPPELQYDIPVTKRITRELSEEDIPRIADVVREELGAGGEVRELPHVPNLGHAGEKVFGILQEIEEELR